MPIRTLYKKIMFKQIIKIFIIRSLIFNYFLKQIEATNFGKCLTQLMLLTLDHHLALDRNYMICIYFKQIINNSMIKPKIFIVEIVNIKKIIFRLSLNKGTFIY